MFKPNKRHFSALFLVLAGLLMVGALGWRWYQTRKDYFISGAPPQELMDKVEPRSVPYAQIKPPAFLPTDPVILGSISSTVGIIFFGDYTDKASGELARQVIAWAAGKKGDVRVLWHYLPSSSKDGDLGFEATVLSECSRLSDLRWSAHDLMLQTPPASMGDVERLTDKLMDKEGLLYACRRDVNIRKYLREGIDQARGDGIDKAPFVFVGTKAFPSQNSSSTGILKAAQNFLSL